jgi:hypothetical protein
MDMVLSLLTLKQGTYTANELPFGLLLHRASLPVTPWVPWSSNRADDRAESIEYRRFCDQRFHPHVSCLAHASQCGSSMRHLNQIGTAGIVLTPASGSTQAP